jgi:hypothetical protein
MEKPEESGAGYPEEQPSEVAGEEGGTPEERRERTGEGGSEATESGDGKATGDRRSAG